MARVRTLWRCQQCGYSAPRWLGRCPDCGEYGSLVEEVEAAERRSASLRSGPAPATQRLSDVGGDTDPRRPTGVEELDRVLGGGLVEGSLVLIGGEPGIGKSTLLLQAAGRMSAAGERVLYVCGEESPKQMAMRAARLGGCGGVRVLAEADLAAVESSIGAEPADFVVVDSIQTAWDPDLDGAPGSVGQVRACTARLMRLAKDRGVTCAIVGHVTKDGAIAGPRVLEHMVDTVLYFEGDRDHSFRIVRAVKNRFGTSAEVGIFEMTESGLAGVGQPSAALLSGRAEDVSGSAVFAGIEGSRPLLVEIQALVAPTCLQTPRRVANGLDHSRVLQVIAVLERRTGLSFGQHDVYVSVAGGVRITEPAADLPLAMALASALRDEAIDGGTAAFGEVGLTGELRGVGRAEARLGEIARMGFVSAVTPAGKRERANDVAVRECRDLRTALDAAIQP